MRPLSPDFAQCLLAQVTRLHRPISAAIAVEGAGILEGFDVQGAKSRSKNALSTISPFATATTRTWWP
jgi:hypothetical protein